LPAFMESESRSCSCGWRAIGSMQRGCSSLLVRLDAHGSEISTSVSLIFEQISLVGVRTFGIRSPYGGQETKQVYRRMQRVGQVADVAEVCNRRINASANSTTYPNTDVSESRRACQHDDDAL